MKKSDGLKLNYAVGAELPLFGLDKLAFDSTVGV